MTRSVARLARLKEMDEVDGRDDVPEPARMLDAAEEEGGERSRRKRKRDPALVQSSDGPFQKRRRA